MSMRRNSITVNESGNIIMPENVSNIWMSEPELVELFGVIAPTLRSAIRNIYNSGALKEYEVQKYVRQENGYHADVFSFPMIVALAFRIDSFGAEQVRNAIFKRLYLRKEKTNIFYGTHALPISICVPVIRSNSRLYLVIRFSSNTFSSIPTLSGL